MTGTVRLFTWSAVKLTCHFQFTITSDWVEPPRAPGRCVIPTWSSCRKCNTSRERVIHQQFSIAPCEVFTGTVVIVTWCGIPPVQCVYPNIVNALGVKESSCNYFKLHMSKQWLQEMRVYHFFISRANFPCTHKCKKTPRGWVTMPIVVIWEWQQKEQSCVHKLFSMITTCKFWKTINFDRAFFTKVTAEVVQRRAPAWFPCFTRHTPHR